MLTAVSPDLWQRLCDGVDVNLVLTRSVGVAALPPGSRLLRAGQNAVSSKADLLRLIPVSRRIWVQSCSPSRAPPADFLTHLAKLFACNWIWSPLVPTCRP